MAELVTLAQAKAHARIETAAYDSDLTLKLAHAQELVLAYITTPDPDWTPETVPARVRGAILAVFGNLNRFRGETENPVEPLNQQVRDLLCGLRDPPLA